MASYPELAAEVATNPLPFGDVVELVKTQAVSTANLYLNHGYRLLRIETESAARQREDKQWWVARKPAFILGRSEAVESWEPVRPS